jgi:hypothetical protein
VILQPDPEVTRPPDGRRGRADPEEHRRPN